MAEHGPETLASIELFHGLSASALQALERRCRFRRFTANQPVVAYQDPGSDVYFILHGRVRVRFYAASGREVTFRDLGAGQVFGELSAIDGKARSAHVVAITESVVASMSAAAFWDCLRQHEAVSRAVLQRLAGMVRMLSERVVEFSTLAVRNRIHAELLRLAREGVRQGNTAVITPAPTHADIASRVSTHREAVTRELSDLARSGLVEKRGHSLVICDVEALQRMVDEVRGE
jgi:CRP/FNR family transcriptional regulator, cyclic AMP receptor protein